MHILATLALAFKAWMVFDAMQRCRGRCGSNYNYWFLICWVPFGDWVYFFMVKIHDPEFRTFGKKLLHRPLSVEQLRYNAKQSPSLANKLSLANALYGERQFEDALSIVDEILNTNNETRDALYLGAMCKKELGKRVESIDALRKLVDSNLNYRDYEPAVTLAEQLWEDDKRAESIELMQKLVKKSERLVHRVTLARLLAANNRAQDAKNILQQAVEDFNHAPRYIRKRDNKHIKDANVLLRTL